MRRRERLETGWKAETGRREMGRRRGGESKGILDSMITAARRAQAGTKRGCIRRGGWVGREVEALEEEARGTQVARVVDGVVAVSGLVVRVRVRKSKPSGTRRERRLSRACPLARPRHPARRPTSHPHHRSFRLSPPASHPHLSPPPMPPMYRSASLWCPPPPCLSSPPEKSSASLSPHRASLRHNPTHPSTRHPPLDRFALPHTLFHPFTRGSGASPRR